MSKIKTDIIEPVGSTLSISGNTAVTGTISGYGTIPIGGIIMWSGSTLPTGWAFCDGSNDTPDLRNRFIVSRNAIGTGTTITGVSSVTGGSKDAIVVTHNHFIANTDTFSGAGAFGTLSTTTTLTEYAGNGSGSDFSYGLAGTATTATIGNTSTEGSSGTNANLPPYYALAFIMRIL
jgi:microcystin-dependent protein